MTERARRVWAWVIGISLIFFAVHNPYQPLIEYVFLPVLGLALSVIVALVVLTNKKVEVSLGPRWLWIPMAFIVLGMALSGFVVGESLGQKFAPLLTGLYLFAIYLVCRVLGEDVFKPFAFAVVVVSVSCVVYGILYPGVGTGGILSPSKAVDTWQPGGNYDIATGVLVFGVLVSPVRHQWWLAAVALIGIVFTGGPEGVFAVAVLAVVVLMRRDWGWRMALPVGVVVLGVGAALLSGHLRPIIEHQYGRGIAPLLPTAFADSEVVWDDSAIGYRWKVIREEMGAMRPFGEGYSITEFTWQTVHNVPLVIVQQVGILPALAWLVATGWLLLRTRWRYAWIGVASLCVFDHFIWTQVAPYWWALAGVSTTIARRDYIFRG
jgi:hypothetical protein